MSGKNPLGLGKEPQQYEGINVLVPIGGWQLIKSSGAFARDPTVNDKKYPVGSLWVNTADNSMWALTSSVAGTANWELLTGDSSYASVTTTSQQMVINQGYIPTSSSLTTFTLPATAPVGSEITIQGSGTGGWTIAQAAGQQIVMNNQATTAGTGGSLSSTNHNNAVTLVATVGGTSTIWTVNDFSGTFTFV